ncbi:class I SAM-dependent methyltransferase [Paenibacillus daejeonensis]|uniref:class I SAM-dependent methyltransferase n=1 Tax=Paenibacillus daejeonensis TaxID=135193 RepID=UPI00039A6B11|nr:methyltransferase domain-containing protein [Paenibacillus daejeonensis]
MGCGHGEFALRWSEVAEQVVGIDAASEYNRLEMGDLPGNVSFVTANTKEALPFSNGAFDVVYNRRGPTSAYLDVKRVLAPGGRLLSIHPGDVEANELAEIFPEWCGSPPAPGTPILDVLKQRLQQGGFEHTEIETVTSVAYLHAPIDVLQMILFGQTPALIEELKSRDLCEITRRFERHATEAGLATTFVRYLVRATV